MFEDARCDWKAAHHRPHLSSSELHVWRAKLHHSAEITRKMTLTLTPHEAARALGYFLPEERVRFIAARAILRDILSRYTSQPPARLRLCSGGRGKPSLACTSAETPALQFNVSHSRGVGLFAVARTLTVGVDLEYVDTNFPVQSVVDVTMCAAEQRELKSLPAHTQREWFFRTWVQKEAFAKATGEGVAFDFAHFNSRGPVPAACNWCGKTFCPECGYVGCVVTAGHNCSLKFWDWTPRLNG